MISEGDVDPGWYVRLVLLDRYDIALFTRAGQWNPSLRSIDLDNGMHTWPQGEPHPLLEARV